MKRNKRNLTNLFVFATLFLALFLFSCNLSHSRTKRLDTRFNQASLSIAKLSSKQVLFSIKDLVFDKKIIIYGGAVQDQAFLDDLHIFWNIRYPDGHSILYQKNEKAKVSAPAIFNVPEDEKTSFILSELPIGMNYIGDVEVNVKIVDRHGNEARGSLEEEFNPHDFMLDDPLIVRGTVTNPLEPYRWTSDSSSRDLEILFDPGQKAYIFFVDTKTHQLYSSTADRKGHFEISLKREGIYDVYLLGPSFPLDYHRNVRISKNRRDNPSLYPWSSSMAPVDKNVTSIALPNNFFNGDFSFIVKRDGTGEIVHEGQGTYSVSGSAISSYDHSNVSDIIVAAVDSAGQLTFTHGKSGHGYGLIRMTLKKDEPYRFTAVARNYAFIENGTNIQLARSQEEATAILGELKMKGGEFSPVVSLVSPPDRKFGDEFIRKGEDVMLTVRDMDFPDEKFYGARIRWSINNRVVKDAVVQQFIKSSPTDPPFVVAQNLNSLLRYNISFPLTVSAEILLNGRSYESSIRFEGYDEKITRETEDQVLELNFLTPENKRTFSLSTGSGHKKITIRPELVTTKVGVGGVSPNGQGTVQYTTNTQSVQRTTDSVFATVYDSALGDGIIPTLHVKVPGSSFDFDVPEDFRRIDGHKIFYDLTRFIREYVNDKHAFDFTAGEPSLITIELTYTSSTGKTIEKSIPYNVTYRID